MAASEPYLLAHGFCELRETEAWDLAPGGKYFAVRGGSRKLKECADAVCESPMDDGIYRELERRGILSGENGTGERREKKAEEREKEICAEERRA